MQTVMGISAVKNRFDGFLYAYLIMACGCIYFLFGFISGADSAQKAGQSVLYQALWFALYLVLLLELAKWLRPVSMLLMSCGFLIAFFTVAAISLHVNEADKGSLIKFAMYLTTIAFAAWLSVNPNSVDNVFRSLFWLGIAVLIVHLAAYPLGSSINWDLLGRPTLIGTAPYAGLFGHKNLAGNFFAVSALVCFSRTLSPSCTNRPIYIGLALVHATMVVLSGAMGALLALLFSSALAFGIYLVSARQGLVALIYWLALGAGALLVEFVGLSSLLQLVGRSTDFTGRDTIWAAGMLFFWQRPLLGYGYANFFASIGQAEQLWSLLPYHAQIWSFDNSYLEVLIQLGAIGGALFAIIVLRAIWAALRFAFTRASAYKIGPIAILSFVLISSISDSLLLLHNYLFGVVVFWAYFGLQPAKQAQIVRARNPLRSPHWRQAMG